MSLFELRPCTSSLTAPRRTLLEVGIAIGSEAGDDGHVVEDEEVLDDGVDGGIQAAVLIAEYVGVDVLGRARSGHHPEEPL